MIGRPELALTVFEPGSLELSASGSRATARFDAAIEGTADGEPVAVRRRFKLELTRRDGAWQVTRAEMSEQESVIVDEWAPLTPTSWRHRLVAGLRRLRHRRARAFAEGAYRPLLAGLDYALPAGGARCDPLPIPPKRLWLGYNYPVHGADHVRTMLAIAESSGYRPSAGDRILDLGCGAGRMIRHLAPLAADCEIWGADISAEHIQWCKARLSPPFRFATTTKVPHLPFEDRSFALVYCGSLFTHIDDLADAWLLELHRILAPGGRLFVTIHDERTLELLGGKRYGGSPLAVQLGRHPFGCGVAGDFAMFTIGRDDGSQVFYRREHFLAMAAPMFDLLSVSEEAYFYQTAVLLGRKPAPARDNEA